MGPSALPGEIAELIEDFGCAGQRRLLAVRLVLAMTLLPDGTSARCSAGVTGLAERLP